jgi:uroporphyrinogen decarboxylase
MSSRERVLAAVGRRLPDRTPADYKAEPEANRKLMQRLGTEDYETLLRRLEVDVRRIEPRYRGPPERILPGGIRQDYWGIRARTMRTPAASYDMFVETSLWAASSLGDLQGHPWPSPDLFDYSGMAAQAEAFPEQAVLYEGSDLFTRPAILRGMENLLVDMVERPEMAHYLIGKFTDFYAEDLSRALEATRGGFQLYCEWSDYGTQGGLLISPAMWREFAGPYLKRLVDLCHSAGVAFMLHSCGAVRDLVPEFIGIGVDVLDPVQTMAVGMQPEGLKRDFGDRIAFHGGLDTQSTLPFGSPKEVRAEVRHRTATLGRHGGYIIAPSHNIQPDTPVENILAMYEPELRETRQGPAGAGSRQGGSHHVHP